MTGKYNYRNFTHFGYLDPNERTFANMMKDAGYKTVIAGKWQLNGLYHKPEGYLDKTRPFQAGFDEYCLWQLSMKAIKKDSTKMTERFWSAPLEQNGELLNKEITQNKYAPDIMSDFVCDFIKKNQNEPFFVYYPTVLVHDPFVATPDNIGNRSKGQIANLAPNNPKDRKENFVEMVNYMDKLVGKIIKQLEDVGQLENTIILFTADNGTSKTISSSWNGHNYNGGKGTTTDFGTPVPLIAYWKGNVIPSVSNELIEFTDFYPTLAQIANYKLNEDDPQDGISFYPQLLNKKGETRKWQVNHYQPY